MKETEDNRLAQIISQRFKELRLSKEDEKGKSYSCRRLAEEIGDEGYYSKINQIENGEKEPSIRDFKRYIKYFGVTFEYLTGISDVKSYKDEHFVENLGINKNCLENGALNYLKRLVENRDYEKLKVINTLLESKEGNKIIEILSYLMFDKDLTLSSNYYSSSLYNDKQVKMNEIIIIDKILDNNSKTLPLYLDSDRIKQILFEELKVNFKKIDKKERFKIKKAKSVSK